MTREIIEEIQEERLRQILSEGYLRQHDDRHTDGSIAMAAACYAATEEISIGEHGADNTAWPWHYEFDKRGQHPRRKQLIIAAALIVAEIERLDRAAVVSLGAYADSK